MNRETIIAISMGIGLGAMVAFVVLFQSNKADETKVVPVAPNKEVPANNNQGADQPSTPKLLSVSSPNQGSVVSTQTVTLQGKAPKNSLLIIQSPSFEQVIQTKEETFSIDVDLALGENVIQVSSYTQSSTPQQQLLRVYYLEE